MDAELRSIYERCDVSNNGTDDPLSFEEFKQWHQQEIAKARINEGQMFREAMINHSTPAIYWGKRLDELSLKEHKD